MAAAGGKHWKTSVFWKKDPDPDNGIVKVHAPGVNIEPPVMIKQPMVRMPVHIRRPRVVTLNRSSLVSQNATQVARHKSASEIDTIPTRDTGSSLDKTNSPEEKRTKLTLKDLSAEDKRRVANLVRELARVGEERELALTQLKEERSAFEERLEILQQEYDAVINEKEYMQNRFLELQTLLKKYKSPEKGSRIPSPKERSNVDTLSEGSRFQASPVRTAARPALESIKGNSRPIPGTPMLPTKGKVSLSDHEIPSSFQVLPPHKGGTGLGGISIPPTSIPPISGPLPSTGGTSKQQLKSISGSSPILAPVTNIPKTQSAVLHPDNSQSSGNWNSSKLGIHCNTTQAVKVQVTSRPQSASVNVSQSTEIGEEDISKLPQFYHLDAVPVRQGSSFHPPADSHKAAAPNNEVSGLQAPTQQEFQRRYSAPAYANRLFDQNVVEDGWRTLPKRSVDRSLTESTVSQAVSAELDAVYRLHCREYELHLQLQQQQLELQRQQLQLQQQLQQLEVFQQQNRPPPAQAQTAPSVEEIPFPPPVPWPSSQPHQASPALSLIPTPDVQETSVERLSQDRSHLCVDSRHDISRDHSHVASQALKAQNTGERTVELCRNSGISTEHSLRRNVHNKENVNSVEHSNTSSQHLYTAHNTPRPGGSQPAEMPELIEETLMESRASSRMSLGRTGHEIQAAPIFAGLAADSQLAQVTLVREGSRSESRASSRATTVLPGYETVQVDMSMAAGQQSSHLNARRDDSFRVGRAGSRTSVRSTDSMKEHESRYYYSLYQEPDSATSVRTLDGGRDGACRVHVGFPREDAPENHSYRDEQRLEHVQRIPRVTSETAASSLDYHDPRRLYSVYSFGPESTGQVRGAVLQDKRYSPHSSSLDSGKGDLEDVRQSHAQEFISSSQKHDSSFHARSVGGSVYPETLVNIVQDLEYNECGLEIRQPGYRGSYQRPPSAIIDRNEGSVRQPEVRSYFQGTTSRPSAASITERARELPRPLSGTVHEKELGLSSHSGFLYDQRTSDIMEERLSLDTPSANEDTRNVERRSRGQAARNSDILTVQRSANHPSSGTTYGVGGTDTADSGYSQDSYRDRSPLTSNREYWDPEQEEADVLNEIFFTNSQKR